MRDPLGEEAREHAEARADLEHDVVGRELGEPLDHAEDVLVDQEVLAERLPRDDGHSAEDGGRVRVDLRRQRVGSTPRASASARQVCIDVRRLVAAAAHRLGSEIRAVGLGQQPVGGHPPRRGAQLVRVLVGDVAGERDVPAVLEARARAAPATRSSAGSTAPP